MFPKTNKKIVTLPALSQIIKLFDNPHELVHAIYLLFKCNLSLLNDMHIRIIVKTYFYIKNAKIF